MPTPIIAEHWDREAQKCLTEVSYAAEEIQWYYSTFLGRFVLNTLTSRKPLSRVLSIYRNSRWSIPRIQREINRFNVQMEDYEDARYGSYADFFLRRFKAGARPFIKDTQRMAAFAEGRYLAFNQVSPDIEFPVKGKFLTLGGIVRDQAIATKFLDGPLLICRLRPIDYHHFHYPDDGMTERSYRIPGDLHSVNLIALKAKQDIFFKNERRVSILKTKNFGTLAFIEVGAMTVGRIVQVKPEESPFQKGEEKGYFMFGASTIILAGQKGSWLPDQDIVEQTRTGRETMIKLGTGIGSPIK